MPTVRQRAQLDSVDADVRTYIHVHTAVCVSDVCVIVRALVCVCVCVCCVAQVGETEQVKEAMRAAEASKMVEAIFMDRLSAGATTADGKPEPPPP
jgi:hypothetical protein